MKLEYICKFALVLTLPFALLSCGDDKKDDDSSGDKAGETAKKTHTQIGEEVGVVMDKLMTSMSGIKDVESAEAFAASVGEHKQTLKDLLAAAKELDPPTEEEKAAVQKMKDASDAKGEELLGTMMQAMAQNADAEAIGEIMQKVMGDQEMEEVTDGLDTLYDLKK